MIRIENQRIYWSSMKDEVSQHIQSLPIKKLKFLQIKKGSKHILIHLKKSQNVLSVESNDDEIQQLITQNHWRELADFRRFRSLNDKPLWALLILLILWITASNLQSNQLYFSSNTSSGAIRLFCHGLSSLGNIKLAALFGGLSVIALAKIFWLSQQSKGDRLFEWKVEEGNVL